jgi:hypothetical protein
MFAPPPRLQFPMTPSRAPSPNMSPGGRRGRIASSSDEGHLRDLSPGATLRAFAEKPMPYDTSRDEYKIFACIETLTPAERDLGARVAKAAQRLKIWCAEIEQWGWSGSFEEPSEEEREQRRRALEMRIREHVKGAGVIDSIGPLEYWGSLLSVEVEAHDGRLDEIGDELLTLDIEELKEHVLDIHGPNRSAPSSAGPEKTRQSYTPMDDFSFLITQTLLAALPNHFQLKDRLSTWTARVSVLRDAPRYLAELKTAQKAMTLGWDAVEPPSDPSDVAFEKWKAALDTISGVLHDKVSHLGQRLDQMLDRLEGHEDRLPEDWIDIYEVVEADFGRWTHESRKRVMEFDMRRKVEQSKVGAKLGEGSERPKAHSDDDDTLTLQHEGLATTIDEAKPVVILTSVEGITDLREARQLKPVESSKNNASMQDVRDVRDVQELQDVRHVRDVKDMRYANEVKEPKDETDVRNQEYTNAIHRSVTAFKADVTKVPNQKFKLASNRTPPEAAFLLGNRLETPIQQPTLYIDEQPEDLAFEADTLSEDLFGDDTLPDDISIFEEGDTVIHHELEESETSSDISHGPSESGSLATVIISTENRPQTPRSRRESLDSVFSDLSFPSSPPSMLEDSPSVRNYTNRQVRAPRPALNAAMAKRRGPRITKELSGAESAPWPPTRFTKPINSAEDLERKISDILTTIPAHIRLTTGTGANAREVKSVRGGLASKDSRTYLRANHAMHGMRSPELTLSPARSDFESPSTSSGRKSATANRSENDIKLYHLTQPGKEQPIKLFIRRVGENGERVMVRVGGGWADLGEYLRQYAEHHGRRAVSDGKFEILGLEVPGPASPESSMGRRDRAQTTSPSSTPQKPAGVGFGILNEDSIPPVPTLPGIVTTPNHNNDTSAPSTGSSRKEWTGSEAGLAGPKTKKFDLSGEKLEWIEGVMKQARTVSSGNLSNSPRSESSHKSNGERAESRSESRTGMRKPDFGDLGKVGGTKRLFVRGGKLQEH